jgi:hypothetical protein
MKSRIMSCTFALALVVCVASATGQGKKKAQLEPTITKLSIKLPSMAPLQESPQLQDKGGLKISVAPVSYAPKVVMGSTTRRVNPGFKEALLQPHQSGDSFVERTWQPSLAVEPSRLRFQIHLSNQMSRVFHGSGIAVQFNVAGKTLAVDPAGYGELVNTILPPRGEQDIEIVGPEISAIPDPSTVGLFLFDVVTKTDSAGNVTEKQNFEWYFSYRCQLIEKNVEVPPPDRLWVHALQR